LQSRSSRVRRDVPEKHGKYDVILSKEAGLLDPFKYFNPPSISIEGLAKLCVFATKTTPSSAFP
jgi:hypothetical protein